MKSVKTRGFRDRNGRIKAYSHEQNGESFYIQVKLERKWDIKEYSYEIIPGKVTGVIETSYDAKIIKKITVELHIGDQHYCYTETYNQEEKTSKKRIKYISEKQEYNFKLGKKNEYLLYGIKKENFIKTSLIFQDTQILEKFEKNKEVFLELKELVDTVDAEKRLIQMNI